MGMERGDCGTAGQLLDSALSPTIYHCGGGMHMNSSQIACTCVYLCIFLCVIPSLSTQFPGAQEYDPFDYF